MELKKSLLDPSVCIQTCMHKYNILVMYLIRFTTEENTSFLQVKVNRVKERVF